MYIYVGTQHSLLYRISLMFIAEHQPFLRFSRYPALKTVVRSWAATGGDCWEPGKELRWINVKYTLVFSLTLSSFQLPLSPVLVF